MNKWMDLSMVDVLLNVSSKKRGKGVEGDTGECS